MDAASTMATVQQIIAEYAVEPLLIIFICLFAAKLLEALLLFILHELRLERQAWRFAVHGITVVAYIATFCLALASVDVLTMVAWFLIGAATIIIALSVLLSLKDFFPNFFAYRKTRETYKRGTIIKTTIGDVRVASVQLLDTHLVTKEGDDLYVPNRSMRSLVNA